MERNLIILLSIICTFQGARIQRDASKLSADTAWLTIVDIENIGQCCEGWPEKALRGIVAVTWQCESGGKDRPWQCLRPAQNHTLFFYQSSGLNSKTSMKNTWTPFTYFGYQTPRFVKLPFETCWSNWKSISEKLYKLREEFQRFGTTSQDEMPDYSPVEMVAISHALGGGFWGTSEGDELAGSLGISEFSKDLAPKQQNLVTEIQMSDKTNALDHMLGDVEFVYDDDDVMRDDIDDMVLEPPSPTKRLDFHDDYNC